MKPELFLTPTPYPHSAAVTEVLAASIAAVEPGQAVRNHLRYEGNVLRVDDFHYDLKQFKRVRLIAFGKASQAMADALIDLLVGVDLEGIVITKGSPAIAGKGKIELVRGAHPVPDESSVAGARRVLALLADSREDDLVIFLISGGGSALMTRPADGIALAELQDLTRLLLESGADIREINTLRKHLDLVKGGGLARAANPATVLALILSDVIGNPLDAIASGPTVPDETTYKDAMQVLERYGIRGKTGEAILSRLEDGIAGNIPETLKPGDACFERVRNVLVGDNLQAARAAAIEAKKQGLKPVILTTSMQGEARQAGRFMAAIARQIASSGEPWPRPVCIIAGGETTVKLTGKGRGGRNLELALGAVEDLAHIPDAALVTLATDGEDGPTDAAGAVVTGCTFENALNFGLTPQRFLAENDSYVFFDSLGLLMKPGPSGTNVNDLTLLFLF